MDQTNDSAWLDALWQSMDERSRDVLTRRIRGETLDSIGQSYGVGRERVRQLQKAATEKLVADQTRNDPTLPDRVLEAAFGHPAIAETELKAAINLRQSTARDTLLREFGLAHPIVSGRDVADLWTFEIHAMAGLLNDLVSAFPCSHDEAIAAARDIGIPAAFNWTQALQSGESRVEWHDMGWIRRNRAQRDLALIWLRAEGAPRTTSSIAKAIDADSDKALREALRRDNSFVQVRPEGTWALSDWRLPGTDQRYTTALDAVIEVLRDLGPMDLHRLQMEATLRYPVTAWRIQQCLASNSIGRNRDGLIDLVERGALPIEDQEPKKPSNIEVSGPVVGVSLKVDADLLRGSGLAVSKWLTWYLGLRNAPSSMYFSLPGTAGDVTVRRGLSNAQLSTLRAAAVELGVATGCAVTLLLRTDTHAADLVHACNPCRSGIPRSRLSPG